MTESGPPLWRFERIPQVGWQRRWLATLMALGISALLGAALITLAGADIGDAWQSLWGGSVGSPRALAETLARATPILLTGQAATLAFRGKVWNIGGEGQLLLGSMVAYWVYPGLNGLPLPLMMVGVTLAGFSGGAALGALAGWLKVRFKVDEIISTVMLNYIVNYLMSFLLSGSGPWREAGSFYQQSAEIAQSAQWPILVEKSRLHGGLVLALAAALGVFLILQKSVLGYQIRAFGFNPIAARFKGINTGQTLVTVMALSGGIAGLAGVSQLFGAEHRLSLDLSQGYGFTGIIVAFVGGLNPLTVILAALGFGALVSGSVRMQVLSDVPSAIVYAFQAILLLVLMASLGMAQYRIKRDPTRDLNPAKVSNPAPKPTLESSHGE